MKKGVALLLACVMLLSFVGCSDAGGEIFGFTLSAEPRQIDPQIAADTASLSVIAATFEGLSRLDDDGNAVAGAATWTVSDDGCTYTFTLKESYWSTVTVRGKETGFEDPVMVTADDFVFGMRRAVMPSTASPYADKLYGIANAKDILTGKKSADTLGVTAVDDKTVVITLTAPDPQFVQKTACPAFMPCNRAFFDYTAGRYGLEKQYILTNGAFYVADWKHGENVSLKKNEHYHAAERILPAAVRYRIGADDAENYALLKKEYIDAALIPPAQLADAKAAGIQTVELTDTVRYLWFNQTDATLANADIRLALRDAIEWQALWGTLGAGYVKADGFVAPAATAGGTIYRTPQHALPLKTDKDSAKAKLARGLEILKLNKMPALTILTAEDNDSANMARYIVQSFSKNLDIVCKLESVSREVLATRVSAGNYQLAIFDVTAGGLTAYENLKMFTSGGIGNYARFADAAYDTQYANANDSAAAVQALERALLDACPALPIGFYTRHYGVAPDVVGVTVRPFNGGAFGALLSFREADRIG